jgi:hypothetical protein
LQTVVETPTFLRRSKECGVTDDERAAIVDLVATDPKCGDEMPGTGGARKLRFARDGKGKRGGYRVITFYSGADIPVFLLSMFAKNEKSDLNQKEKDELSKLLKVLPQAYKKGLHK